MSGCVHGTVRYLWAPSSGAPVSRISPVVCVLKHAVSWPAGALPHVFSQNGVQCDPAHFALLVERWRQSVPVRYHVTARLRACVHVVNALSRAYICRLFRFPSARANPPKYSIMQIVTLRESRRRSRRRRRGACRKSSRQDAARAPAASPGGDAGSAGGAAGACRESSNNTCHA